MHYFNDILCKRKKMDLIQRYQMRIFTMVTVWKCKWSRNNAYNWQTTGTKTMNAHKICCEQKCSHQIYGTSCLPLNTKKMKIISLQTVALCSWCVVLAYYSFVNILLLLLFMKSFSCAHSFVYQLTEHNELHQIKWGP